MERLADRVILVWGFKRSLLAIAAGAFAVLALPPIGFFAAMFVSFTLLVWLIDGAAASPESGLIGRLWLSVCHRLAVRLRLFRRFTSGGSAMRCWSIRKNSPGRCRWQSSGCLSLSCNLLRAGGCPCPHLLVRWHGADRRPCGRLRADGMASKRDPHRLSLECHRLRHDAGSADDAVGTCDRGDGGDGPCRLRLFRACPCRDTARGAAGHRACCPAVCRPSRLWRLCSPSRAAAGRLARGQTAGGAAGAA